MGMGIDRKTAIELIGSERMALMRSCIEDGWAIYDEVFRPYMPLAGPVQLANTLFALVTERARQTLREEHGFHILDGAVHGRFNVVVDGSVVVQFRKLTKDFLTTNHRTDTSDAYDRQEPGIEGLPDAPRLTVGYQLDQYLMSVAGTYLAFNIGQENVWWSDLASGEHSITLEFPGVDGPGAADQEADAEREASEQSDEEEEA